MSIQNKKWYEKTLSQSSPRTKVILNCIMLMIGVTIVVATIMLATLQLFGSTRAFTGMVEPRLDRDKKVLDYQIFALGNMMADVVCSKFDNGIKLVIPCREGDELAMPGMKYWDMMAAQFGRPCDCNCKPAEKPILVSSKQVDKKVANGQACRTMLHEYSDGHTEVEHQKFMAVDIANHKELWMTLTENCDSFLAKFEKPPSLSFSYVPVVDDDRSCVRCCKEK